MPDVLSSIAETGEESKDTSIVEHEQHLDDIKKTFDKKENLLKMKKVKPAVLAVITALILGFLAVWFVTSRNGDFLSPLGDGLVEDLGLKVVNPLTGEAQVGVVEWQDRRPLAVMVNNHVDARPQSGLIYADIVFEIVAEGGITRLMPFYLSEIPEKIGPVRSTREYYLVLVKELGDAMLMHIGWSPQALEAIETWPVRSLGRGGAPFWRDNPRNVATEHTAYIDGNVMYETSEALGWEGTRDFQVWKFKDDLSLYNDHPSVSNIAIDFWYRGDYSAAFQYDAGDNSYLRFMGYDENDVAIPHKDQETEEQIKVKNLIVQFVTEEAIPGDDKNRLNYELAGTGTGIVFLDGKAIDVTWNKQDRDGRTIYYDLDGQEIQFNRGKFWVSVVPDRNIEQVVYN